jgi:hypothetical protein
LFILKKPQYWTIIPWIESCPCDDNSCSSWRFTWLFIEIQRTVLHG